MCVVCVRSLRFNLSSCGLPTTCAAGTYCPSLDINTPVGAPCDAGYYCIAASSTPRPAACFTLPGFVCPPGSSTSGGQPCVPGTYSSGGLAAASCSECPIGRFGVGASVNGSCSGQCDAGYACGAGSTSPNDSAAACPASTWSGVGASVCQLCDAGSFGNTSASASSRCSGDCDAAPGFGCRAGSLSRSGAACDPGRYSRGGAVDCSACPAGTYGNASALATEACSGGCAPGRFSDAGSTNCSACPPGFVCAGVATTRATMQLCPYGYACGVSTANGTAVSCGSGVWCPRGTVTPTTARACIPGVTATSWVDLNGDGAVDAVGSKGDGSPLLWLSSNDAASWSGGDCNSIEAILPRASGSSWTSVVVADFSGDGVSDVLASSPGGSTLSLWMARSSAWGAATPVYADSVPVIAAGASGNTSAVAIADVNGDGDVDVVLASSNGIAVLHNHGVGAFSSPTSLLPGEECVSVMVADVDGDGDVDVVALCRNSQFVLVNSGGGNFTLSVAASSGNATGGCIGDVDGDGDTDVIVCSSSDASPTLLRRVGGAYSREVVDGGVGVGASQCSMADMDNDGDVDVVLVGGSVGRVLPSNGTHVSAVGAAVLSGGSGSAVAVDGDGDGDLDVPTVSYNNSLSSSLLTRSLHIRLLDRCGSRNQFGARVCVRHGGGGFRRCGYVDGVASSGGQSHYDVHAGVPSSSLSYDVDAVFVGGRVHNASTQAALRGVVPSSRHATGAGAVTVRDVPWLTRLTAVAGPGAVVGVGGVINVSVTAAWGDDTLSPSPRCFVNGVNVSGVWNRVGGGVYVFTYVVSAGDAEVVSGSLTASITMRSTACPDAVSDVMSTLDANTVAVDATPPRLTLVVGDGCGPSNGSAWGSANATLCVSCGTTVEERYGCSLSYTVDGGSMVAMPLTTTNRFNVSVVGPHGTGSRPRLWLRVVDSVGNVAETSVSWLVDLESPMTIWRVFPPPLTNVTTPEFRFDSNKPNTRFEYSFDGGARVVLGGNSSSPSSATSPVATDDTVVNASCRRVVSSSTPTCVVVARYDSVRDATVTVRRSDAGNATVQVRLDGGGVWRDVRSLPLSMYNDSDGSLTLSSGVSGSHAVELRAVGSDNTADLTPSVFAWVVDAAPPVLSYVVAPPRYAAVPSDVAVFVLRCSDGMDGRGEVPLAVYEWQLWRRGVDGSWVAATAGVSRSHRASVSLSSLSSNSTYELRSACVDAADHRSDVVTHVWHSGECVAASHFDVDVRAVGSSVAVGERVFSWSAPNRPAPPPYGFEYRLDGGRWDRTADFHVVVSVGASAWHAFEVRPYIPRVCGGEMSPAAGDTLRWFEREAGHGSPGIVSSPALSSSSLFADFAFNCSGLDAWLQYSLDGSSWAGSDATLRMGPLSSGPHDMRVRCVNSGGLDASDVVSFMWTVVSASNSSLTLPGVSDGPHRLTVWAVDAVGNDEVQPRTLEWTVDTVPPVNVAVLASRPVTNDGVVMLNVSCGGEESPSLCVYCWQLQSSPSPPSSESMLIAGCSSNTSLVLPSRPCDVSCSDGAVSLLVTAIDSAGNRNASAVVVSWTVDTSPPSTIAVLNTTSTWHIWLPALATYIVNSSSLQLSLSTSETVALFAVMVDGNAVAVLSSGVVSELLDGPHSLLVAAVDLAGNVDPSPVVLPVYVDTMPPLSTVVTVTSPSVLQRNATLVSLSLSCVGESPGLASHFLLVSSPSLPLSSMVPLNTTELSLSSSVWTTVAVSSGVYVVNVSCVDVAGRMQRLPTSVVVTVDSEPPTCSLDTLPSFSGVANVTLHVSASDALSIPVVFTVVSGDGRVVSEASVGSDVTVLVSALSDGVHAWRVVCVDGAGNVASPSQLVSVTIDTVRPVVWLPSPPPRYSAATTAVAVCRSDASPGTIAASLNVDVVSVTPMAAGDVCINVSVVTDGSYVLTAGGSDAAGNVAASVTFAFTLDRAPPLCSYATPPPPFMSNTSVWLPLSVSDALSPVSLSERVDGGVSSEARSTRLFEGLTEGLHSWSLLCADAAGNTASQWLTVNTTVDVTPPTLTLTSGPSHFVNVTIVRVCASVVDANAGSLLLSGSTSSSVEVVDASSDSACWSVTTHGDGNHSVTVSSVDAAGNAATPLHTWFVVDTSPPTHVATLRNDSHCAVGDATVCDALVLDVGCNSSDSVSATSAIVQSRCHVDVAVVLLRRASSGSGCDAGLSKSVVNGSDVAPTQKLSWLSLPSNAISHDVGVTVEGLYALMTRSVDAGGNVGRVTNISVWLDVTPPTSPPTLTRSPDAVTLQTDGLFELRGVDDGSPGQLSFAYQHTWNGGGDDTYTAVPTLPSTPTSVVLLSLPRLTTDATHLLRLVAVDPLRRRSGGVTAFSWRVLSAAPIVNVTHTPANVSALHAPTFVFSAVWGGSLSGAAGGLSPQQLSSVMFQVRLLGLAGDVGSWHHPCRFAVNASDCASRCDAGACVYAASLPTPASYTLQVRAMLNGTSGEASVFSWTYKRCRDSEFAVLSGPNGDAIECRACPSGGDCTASSLTDVVTQGNIAAREGYWASSSSDGSRFYRCPIIGACVGGGNGSRAVCATGYAHVACSLCADGYFEQFGLCVACPKSSGASVGALFGLAMLLVAICGGLYVVRDLLPIDVIKLGVSMVQIIASANSAYDIPWPSTFRRFLSLLRVFLVDVVAITQASCAQPMNYYASMVVVCMGLKLVLALLLLGPWVWSHLVARGCCVTRAARAVLVRRKVAAVKASMTGRHRGSVARAVVAVVTSVHSNFSSINWTGVFKASFMLLFIAYPGVSLKVLRLFKCRQIEGVWWLAADMRLRCYDGRWVGFAIYGLIMAVLYVVGLPAAVLWILWRRRHKLFGSPTDPFVASTRATFGFLYADYGSSAWWWEVEELARKLLLSAVVVLIDEGSPLQVTLAVLVSGWAHVLHAMYKPWGGGSVLYSLQHGALFVTSFVFLMGLLFKVDGVSSSSGTYSALSGIMVTLCAAFMAAWVAVIALRVASMWHAARNLKTSLSRRQSRSDDRAVTTATRVTDMSGRASSGAVGAVTVVDAFSASGVTAMSDATAAAPSGGFVVVNPLRHAAKVSGGRGGPSGVADSDRDAPESTSGAVHGTSHSDRGDGSGSGSGAGEQRHATTSVTVSRLQRVLSTQQPVASKRSSEAPRVPNHGRD